MANATTAAEALKIWLARYQDLQALVEVLEKVGSLNQVEAEAKERIEKVNAREAKAVTDLKIAEDDLTKAKADIDEVVRAGTMQAAKIINDAQAAAEATLSRAVADAGNEAVSAKDSAASLISAAKSKAAAIDVETAAARAALESLGAQFAEKRDELSEINNKLAAARASIAELLGR